MKLYAQYIKERENKDLLEKYFGFCVYKINKDHTYLQDVYIIPECRREGYCKYFVEEVEKIARENGQNIILTSFSLNAAGWNQSKIAAQKCGFKYYTKDKVNKMIYCIKEIS